MSDFTFTETQINNALDVAVENLDDKGVAKFTAQEVIEEVKHFLKTIKEHPNDN